MRQRGPWLAILPGRQCGPCRLCGHSSVKYAHPLTWDEVIKQKLFALESIDDHSCVCKACDRDKTEHFKCALYTTVETKLWELHNPCMQENKWKWGGNYSHCLRNSAAGWAVPTASAGQLTPLYQAHYKHVHRLLNTEMYQHVNLINVVMLISTLQMRLQYAPIVTILTLKFYICLRKSVLTMISKPSLRPLHL